VNTGLSEYLKVLRDYTGAMAVIEVRIELKKGVADPEGKNTKKTLESLGFKVGDVKSVKFFEIELDMDPKKAKETGEEMCKKLLANPVIQNFTVTVK
jgi:phosphoribosylformylglycinamidine synthase, purS protein